MDALEHIIRATWKCQLLLLITRALRKKNERYNNLGVVGQNYAKIILYEFKCKIFPSSLLEFAGLDSTGSLL